MGTITLSSNCSAWVKDDAGDNEVPILSLREGSEDFVYILIEF